jgi:uncharacterized protein (DUF3084 family)
MNTKQTVYNILASAKPVKVELGLVEDLAKAVKYLEEGQKNEAAGRKVWDKYSSALGEAIKGRAKLEAELQNLKSYQKFITAAVSKVDAMAKELGVDPNTIPNYKEVVSNKSINSSIDALSAWVRWLPSKG